MLIELLRYNNHNSRVGLCSKLQHVSSYVDASVAAAVSVRPWLNA